VFGLKKNEIRDFLKKKAKVLVINNFITEVQLRDLYAVADVYVHINQGEGWYVLQKQSISCFHFTPSCLPRSYFPHFSLPCPRSSSVAEAMSMGLPVVIAKHENVLEFVDESVGYLVDVQERSEDDARASGKL
tara:strand:- start:277 stop:675 length:399 start_codon:yes stop_codon:yes gene_type:complete